MYCQALLFAYLSVGVLASLQRVHTEANICVQACFNFVYITANPKDYPFSAYEVRVGLGSSMPMVSAPNSVPLPINELTTSKAFGTPNGVLTAMENIYYPMGIMVRS